MSSAGPSGSDTLRGRLPLYVGGFMGPFGTVVIIPMFPELRDEFDASQTAVSLGFSLYLVPFAALLLVSGTLGERWGRRRTVRVTYLLYAVASLLAAVAPNLTLFIAARAIQGVANAFITPLLVAGLAELVPPERLGRQVGIYSSFQALGTGLGPVVGGLAADTEWRIAFLGAAAVAVLLATSPPPGEARPEAEAPRVRSLVTRDLVVLGVAFFFLGAGPAGAGVLVGVAGRDVLDLSGTATGVVLFAGALSAMALGPMLGQSLDRIGLRRFALGAVTLVSALTIPPAAAGAGWSLALAWVLASGAIAATIVVFQSVGATIVPDNRGGALSFILSFRFFGHAVGPLVLVPMIDWSVWGAFIVSGALGLVTLICVSQVVRS